MHIEHVWSPLPYNHAAPVHRIQIVIRDVDPPKPSDTYFSPTATTTVKGKKIVLSPADKGVVSFLDWHEVAYSGGVQEVAIDFVKTRQDMSRLGLATMLVEELYRMHPDVPTIDYGKIASDGGERLYRRMQKKDKRNTRAKLF